MFNPLSLSSLKIEMYQEFENSELQILSTGTAFFYNYDEYVYLITNRHNVTGKSPNNDCISKNGGLPRGLKLFLHKKIFNEKGSFIIEWEVEKLNLYKLISDEFFPIWFDHPVHGAIVDVVAIPFCSLDSFKLRNISNEIINKIESSMIVDFDFYAGMDAFILGYPLALTGGGNFPIWKRGTIATEYIVNIDNLPKYYIDTATTKEGMSGSPIFIQSNGITYPKGQYNFGDALLGNCYAFGGIYSGRYRVNDKMADLAIVWKKQAIDEIIKAAKISHHKYWG